SARVVVRNIGLGGALVEARLSPSLRSLRTAQMSLRDHGPELNVVVRHMEPVSADPGEERYLLGLEFIHLSADARTELTKVVRETYRLQMDTGTYGPLRRRASANSSGRADRRTHPVTGS